MQEKAIEAALKKKKNTFNPIGNADVVKSTSMTTTRPTTYRLSPEVYEYMKNNHLIEEANVGVEDIAHNIIIEGEIEQEMQEVGCLSALSGNHTVENTILVKGTVKNRHMAILVDFGITYNFIDKSTVKETGHKVSYCPPVRVTESDRNYVMCTSHCQGFSGKM
ncbi:hypothetical protein KY290_031288 [Solanum tuberosum]|uniref:Gag-pol polyprotein n=1 Tax=Solanum tuberosum TaxID=4113 RepID=A0ABQ7U8W7_SOLTU|nr:hypothetical protein KY290_031288 [Solanum tuberosum]